MISESPEPPAMRKICSDNRDHLSAHSLKPPALPGDTYYKLKLLTIWGPELFRFRGFRKSKTDMICKVVIKDDITIYELAYLWSNIGGLGSPSTGVYITKD
jgi:hypothetical protein